MILKGTAAAEAYPYPEQRAMGDVDFLVPPACYDAAYEQMVRNGYQLVGDIDESPKHVELCKEGVDFELHRILKQGTSDAALTWFAVGDYKRRANVVGGRETAKPEEVSSEMKALLSGYEFLEFVTIDDIIRFHYEFERIHPFQDGNGRIGRLIALKECLRHSIVPFIIEDSKKMYYYRGLSAWETEKGYLTETCLDGQDTFRKLMSMFDIRV